MNAQPELESTNAHGARDRKARIAVSKEEEANRQEELAEQTIDQTDTESDDPTNSNTVANSGLEKTLEELNLGAERNVIY